MRLNQICNAKGSAQTSIRQIRRNNGSQSAARADVGLGKILTRTRRTLSKVKTAHNGSICIRFYLLYSMHCFIFIIFFEKEEQHEDYIQNTGNNSFSWAWDLHDNNLTQFSFVLQVAFAELGKNELSEQYLSG